MVRLGEVCLIDPPKTEVRHLPPDTEVSFVPMAALEEHTVNIHAPEVRKLGDVLKGYTYFRNGDVLLAKITPCFQNGKCVIADNLLNGIGFGTTEFIVIRPKTDKVLPELVYYCVTRPAFVQRGLECMTGSAGQQRVPANCVSEAEIPLPPLKIQEQIVVELDGYRKVIEGAHQIIANYKPTIKIDPKWPMVKLGPSTTLVSSGVTPLGGKDNYHSDGILFIRSQNVLRGFCDFGDAAFISAEMHKSMSRTHVQRRDVLLNITGASIGRCAVFADDRQANVNQHVCVIRLDESRLGSDFLCSVINQPSFQDYIMQIQSGASRQALNFQQIRDFDIPLPPLAIQRQIVAEIEAERAMVEANRKLVEIFERKIQAVLASVWVKK